MPVQIARAPGGNLTSAGSLSTVAPELPQKGKGDGLGFVSKDFADLFRELTGHLANKDPIELKPPYRVHRAKVEDVKISGYPVGVLSAQVRMPGSKFAIQDVVRGEYMKWAIVESLSEMLTKIGKVRVRPAMVFFCADEVEILDVHMPCIGETVWQFCEFRFDYKAGVKTAEEAQKLVYNVFTQMVEAEKDFCKNLEFKFRNIYHITVLSLLSKRFLLMDGQAMSDELALFEAAQDNDCQALEALIKRGTDVDASQKAASFPGKLLDEEQRFLYVTLGRTALLGAAEEGHVEAMRMLLDAQADVNFQDNSGFHALYLAAGVPEGAEKAVNFLLARDAEVNLANSAGYTPLHNACGSGQVGAMKALLEAKGDLNIRSRNGAAPIHTAVINKQPAVLEALKNLGANLDMPAFGGNTPVHEGVMQNNPDIIQKLFELNADVNIESGPEHGFATPLRMATERKKKKALKKLQELGAVERIEHEYEESSEGEFQSLGDGEFVPRVKGRLAY